MLRDAGPHRDPAGRAIAMRAAAVLWDIFPEEVLQYDCARCSLNDVNVG